MLSFRHGVARVCGAVWVVATAATAQAQWFGRGADCGCSAAPAPVYSTAMVSDGCSACSAVTPVTQQACQPALQPVMQTCYQSVPVTEYQQVRQTVQKPTYETKYVDQQVTEYRPVTECKTVSVPQTMYQDVTEYQTVCRNVGYWRTQVDPVAKCTPCQVDNRPGFMGWMNRTGYEISSAFQPNYRVRREYVPQVVAQQVPVTRRVAYQTTRQMAYNVTRMVPEQVTRKVAMQTVKWVNEEVVAMRPVTVMRNVPIGTQVAWVPAGSTGTATALAPIPDAAATARRPSDPKRTANAHSDDAFEGSDPGEAQPVPAKKISQPYDAQTPALPRLRKLVTERDLPATTNQADDEEVVAIPARQAPPSIVQVGRWVARTNRDVAVEAAPAPAGQSTRGPVSLANIDE